MKHLLLSAIWLYQVFLAVFLKNVIGVKSVCRFEETCSDYARRSIIQHGVLKGSYKSIKRILMCQPFF